MLTAQSEIKYLATKRSCLVTGHPKQPTNHCPRLGNAPLIVFCQQTKNLAVGVFYGDLHVFGKGRSMSIATSNCH